MKLRGLFVTVLLALAGFALYSAGSLFFFANRPLSPGSTQKTIIQVQKGEGPGRISDALVKAGAIEDADRLRWIGRIHGAWGKVKAGEYEVGPGMSPLQILAVVTSGISVQYPVTLREGINIYETAEAIAAKGLAPREEVLALLRDPKFTAETLAAFQLSEFGVEPKTLEGYLYPDTYFFNRTMSAPDMIRTMVKHFAAAWTPDLAAKAKTFGFNRHQTITLASMIEKETGAGSERPLISSVFHNRLRKRMRLQSDPTTIYGMWERYVKQGNNIRKDDLFEKNDYNTYQVPALPIGPIGNPGIEALNAALTPATSDYLYFVSHNDGTHAFTRTYEEHLAEVKKWQLDRSAREGKSWRDLNKAANESNPSP